MKLKLLIPSRTIPVFCFFFPPAVVGVLPVQVLPGRRVLVKTHQFEISTLCGVVSQFPGALPPCCVSDPISSHGCDCH